MASGVYLVGEKATERLGGFAEDDLEERFFSRSPEALAPAFASVVVTKSICIPIVASYPQFDSCRTSSRH